MNFRDRISRLPQAGEICLVVGILFGWPIVMSLHTLIVHHPIQPYSSLSLLLKMVYEVVVMGLAATILGWRGWHLGDFNFRASLWPTFTGLMLAIMTWGLWSVALWLIVNLPGLNLPALERLAQELGQMKSQVNLTIDLLFINLNSVYEETFVVGYLIQALEAEGLFFAIGASVLLRLLCHTYQGPLAIATILPMGFLFALTYWYQRSLWALFLAHVLINLVP